MAGPWLGSDGGWGIECEEGVKRVCYVSVGSVFVNGIWGGGGVKC